MVWDFAESPMRFRADTQVNGHVWPQLDVVLHKKRRIPCPHSVLRLGRTAPLLYISQQEVGVAYVNLGVGGGVLAGESEVCSINAAPWSRVILLKQHLAAKGQNVLSRNRGENIPGDEGFQKKHCVRPGPH